MVNSISRIALTKLDVLSGFDEIQVCTSYKGYSHPPSDAESLEEVEPQYEILPGWSEDISGVRNLSDLPENCRAYIRRIEELVGIDVGLVSVGPGRLDTILADDFFRQGQVGV
jgi:adenylosuccinate synthase